MRCGSCTMTDGLCYTSNPPKVCCACTGRFHYYTDWCDCEDARATASNIGEQVKHILNTPILAYTPDMSLNLPSVNDFGVEAALAPATHCVRCIICGEYISCTDSDIFEHTICVQCKKAILFVKEKFKEELSG